MDARLAGMTMREKGDPGASAGSATLAGVTVQKKETVKGLFFYSRKMTKPTCLGTTS